MVSLPLLEYLHVENYGMFPGTPEEPGLRVTFEPGLTLILGANGLGKTTLVTMLYRICAGPFDIAGLATARTLGTKALDASRLPVTATRMFASRVVDNAGTSTATLRMRLGDSEVQVTRSLNNLRLAALYCDGEELQTSEDRYQQLVVELAGLPSFGEWILLLRYLTFYFEDRRALVWDSRAQYQVLRLLLLSMPLADAWARKEREVLELDSRVRNLTNTLNKEEGEEERALRKVRDKTSILEEVNALEARLKKTSPQLEGLSDQLADAEAERHRCRLRALTVEQEYDTAYRALERLQLARISNAFPSGSETARYLITLLLSDGRCRTCGNEVPEFATDLDTRLREHHCVICASPLDRHGKSDRRLARQIEEASASLAGLEVALSSARHTREQAEVTYEALLTNFQLLEAEVSESRARLRVLVSRLPPDERHLHGQSLEIKSLRGRLNVHKRKLEVERGEYDALVKKDMVLIAKESRRIIDAFERFAEGFLLESCRLAWNPQRLRVGQTGPLIELPAFEVEMSGSNFPSPVRRSGPDQVSESQREFIDLAFRMALLAIATESKAGTLVIDAPESSLDTVFSQRAAEVLSRFSDPGSRNRLIITSNLVEGGLVPDLVRLAGIESATSGRVVDLFELAVPTAATRELDAEYREVRDSLFNSAAEV